MFSIRLPMFTLAALCASSVTAHAAPLCKPPAPLRLVERFMSADCESCWAAAGSSAEVGRTMVLDWIAPTSESAPLAVGAVAEAIARAGALTTSTTKQQATVLQASAPRLRIADGPAWNGYIGLQLTVHRGAPLPAGATAYVALVERVAAGSEGSGVARQLVRNVVGPLSLEELATTSTVHHFRAMRLPEGAQVEKLASVAWVENAEGKVLAATQSAKQPANAKCKIAR